MKKYINFLAIGVLLICFLKVGFEFFVGLERRNKYYPHIDTRFSKDFKVANWDKIKIGDTITTVYNLIGHPLVKSYKAISSKRPGSCYYEEQFSQDGKWGYADFAWQSFTVYYNRDFKIMALDSTWWYN